MSRDTGAHGRGRGLLNNVTWGGRVSEVHQKSVTYYLNGPLSYVRC